MVSIDLASATRIYELSASVEIEQHPVSDPDLKDLNDRVRTLQSSLGEHGADDYWRRFLAPVRRIRFYLHFAPILPTTPGLRFEEQVAGIRSHIAFCDRAYPDFARAATGVVDGLDQYLRSDSHAMFDEVAGLCRRLKGESVAILGRSGRVASLVEESIAGVAAFAVTKAIGVHDLRAGEFYDSIVVAGPLGEFPPRHVLESPRSKTVHFVYHDTFRFQWQPSSVFLGEEESDEGTGVQESIRGHWGSHEQTRPPPFVLAESSDLDPDVLNPGFDLAELSNVQAAASGFGGGLDDVAAKLIVLEGDQGVLLKSESSARALVLRVQDEGPDVLRLSVRELDDECFLLLRGESGTDFVIPLADRLLGDRKDELRAVQQEWKLGLGTLFSQHGPEGAAELLRRLGLRIASAGNVRNWIDLSERNIRTGRFEDFAVIMKAIGLESKAEDHWHLLGLVDNAHLRAGQQMRRMLLAEVASVDLSRLIAHGRVEISLEDRDIGTLVIARVLHIGDAEIMVRPSQLGDLFHLGDML